MKNNSNTPFDALSREADQKILGMMLHAAMEPIIKKMHDLDIKSCGCLNPLTNENEVYGVQLMLLETERELRDFMPASEYENMMREMGEDDSQEDLG